MPHHTTSWTIAERVPPDGAHRQQALCSSYLLYHPASDRAYIGSTDNTYRRESTHKSLLMSGRHPNRSLQAAFDENPQIEITVMYTETKAEAQEFEQIVLDEFGNTEALFNVAVDASSCMGGRRHSAETLARMSASHTGKIVSEQTRLRMSLAKLGRPVSEETRANLDAGRLARMRAVNIGGAYYESVSHAAAVLGTNRETVRQRINDPRPEWSRWTYAY